MQKWPFFGSSDIPFLSHTDIHEACVSQRCLLQWPVPGSAVVAALIVEVNSFGERSSVWQFYYK